MVSSLAAQLAQSASLNTTLLSDKARRKAGESYLFTGREADQHDLDSIYALAVNAFIQLCSLSPTLRQYEASLFSDAAKNTDRTMLTSDQISQLDRSIASFLRLIGPYVLEPPTGKAIEWLVRRFRINEFNVPDILVLFLPYHESPHFAKMVTILHVPANSTWSFLLAYKAAAQNIPRVSLVSEMLRNVDVSRFIFSLLPDALKSASSHRALIAFNAATAHDFIIRNKVLDEGTVAYVLPALLSPVQHKSETHPTSKDCILGSYILLAAFSQKCQLTASALKIILAAMASCARRVAVHQFVNAAVSVCEPQDQTDILSETAVKAILRLPKIEEEICKASLWVGSEKFICPLIDALVPRIAEESIFAFISEIHTGPKVPAVIIHHSVTALVELVISTADLPANIPARRLLTAAQQRRPKILQEVTDTVGSRTEDAKEAMEQLVISLSMTYAAGKNTTLNVSEHLDVIIASTSADANVRTAAVKTLLKSVAGNPSLELESALSARVQDTNVQVLEALYSDPAVLVPILAKDPSSYIDHLVSALTAPSASKPRRAFLRTHLTFLTLQFCVLAQPSPELQADIFHRLVFPFLLFSKPRQHSAEVVWEVLSSVAVGGLGSFPLIAGCIDTWKWEKDKVGSNPVEVMVAINLAVASKIADNILVSSSYDSYLASLLVKLQDENPHTRSLGYLIARSLLGRLPAGRQLEAAHVIMKTINVEQLGGVNDLPANGDQLHTLLHDASLGKTVVLKPNSRNTLLWLQASIVALVPAIPCPVGVSIHWMGNTTSIDPKGTLYMDLMQNVYRLANAPASLPALTTNLLSALFINLKDDAIMVLAGLWTAPSSSDHIRLVALQHAAAFLAAHLGEEKVVDFQTVLPSVLIALLNSDGATRRAALDCVSLLAALSQKEFTAVYGFDAIYGSSSDQLQYLDHNDCRRYITAITEHQEHIVNDPTYLVVLHTEHLLRVKGEKKKESEYKHRILCYLLSHITALDFIDAQVPLLKSIAHVSDKVKAEMLQDCALALVGTESATGSLVDEYACLLVSCFDNGTAADLNAEHNMLWHVYVSALQHYLKTGSATSPREIMRTTLEHGLFASLKAEHQIEVCELLLKIGSEDTKAYSYCKKTLSSVVGEVSLITHFLKKLNPSVPEGSPKGNKRVKTTGPAEDSLARLSLLVEVLGTKSLPGSIDLISRLLDTLSKILQYASPSQADTSYTQQLLMSAVESAASKVVEIPNLIPSAVRLDILVELIRVAENPQTFHQALLLIASLARLAPDSVLHNVMPVFTFMGSNVFHRDDTYSFRVVQKTIDSIVPVMVSSLKREYSERLELSIGSRGFLRIFTDAANHIPRHRRTNFFSHLIDVLGPEDFMAPVCMLLVEKVANRIIRLSAEEAQSFLVLPISVLQHYPFHLHTFVFTEMLRESKRLATRAINVEDTQPTFLEPLQDEEHSLPITTSLKRRSQALITFVGYALKSSRDTNVVSSLVPEGGSMSDLVALLIGMATGVQAVEEIPKAAHFTISRALSVMSASDFIKAILAMLESGDNTVQIGAFNLLAERLSSVSDTVRREMTSTITKIVDFIRTIITAPMESPLTVAAYGGLKSICVTAAPGEEASLTNIITLLLKTIRARKQAAAAAIAVLAPLILKLGPRVIPFFRDIVSETVAVIQESVEGAADDAMAVLNGLLVSIPAFWGSVELIQVVKLSIGLNGVHKGSLLKSIAKRAPTKVLLPALYELWPSLYADEQLASNLGPRMAYFDLLKRTLRSAERPSVLEHLRPLFKLFLEAFDIAQLPSPDAANAENQVISAFLELVVKLNEAAFRPLFRKLYDWAFTGNSAQASARKITFCHVYMTLLDFFKELMTPYMSLLLQPFVDLLGQYSQSSLEDATLWLCIIETLNKSLVVDDGVFWRDDKLRLLASPLVAQLPVSITLDSAQGKTALPACLTALATCITDDTVLKSVNLDVLMHTRSEDAQLRTSALSCSCQLWDACGSKLLGFVPETATFIQECAEDENDVVVKESRALKEVVESVAGNIAEL